MGAGDATVNMKHLVTQTRPCRYHHDGAMFCCLLLGLLAATALIKPCCCPQLKHGEDRLALTRGLVVRSKECGMARKARVFRVLVSHGANVRVKSR